MSFYLRKSVKAGPFRFNLSKSGVGVSAGVPGFRVGTGPRGNYVRVGGSGVFYRATRPQQSTPDSGWTPPPPAPVADVLLEDVTGATAAELAPSGSSDVVAQLNGAATIASTRSCSTAHSISSARAASTGSCNARNRLRLKSWIRCWGPPLLRRLKPPKCPVISPVNERERRGRSPSRTPD